MLLVFMETDGQRLPDVTLSSIKFAQDVSRTWETPFDLLAIGGAEIAAQTDNWRDLGARRIWVAAHDMLIHPTADRAAVVCHQVLRQIGAEVVIGAATTFGKDVLPRLAEAADLPMISDLIGIGADSSGLQFLRPMYAGNVVATMELADRRAVFSVRPSAFRDPERGLPASDVTAFPVNADELPTGTTWVALEAAARSRPELTAARVVVSGGRPLRDAATFERVLGGLADALGGAVGATRAAVDSGIAPNELQVGQTGKSVAPELYIAAGVSGSVQHLAGMKDSRVIVAINTDPDAPIFSVADYGLIADLHQAVPELTERVRQIQ